MLKIKNSTTGNQNSLCFTRWASARKVSLCFNSGLNSCRNLHFLNFIGRLFHKTLPLKVNEFISYFWVFTLRIEREIPLLSKYRISHEKYGLSVLWVIKCIKCIMGYGLFVYFNGQELQIPLMSLQFIIQS